MNSSSQKPIRLVRQASVLHELQENESKECIENRYARLMSELKSLCSDRYYVLNQDSLTHATMSGRPMPAKLQKSLDKASSDRTTLVKAQANTIDTPALSGRSTGNRRDIDRVHVDTIRRQRVEELARFFMEAKSDIEFALGSNAQSRQSREVQAIIRDSNRDKDEDTERDEEPSSGIADDPFEESEQNKESISADSNRNETEPADSGQEALRFHMSLLSDQTDTRLFNGLLSELRETDPALYGSILCHPLITGVDQKKEKKRKKKRKDRERKERAHGLTSSISSISTSDSGNMISSNAILTPDFNAGSIQPSECAHNLSIFVAKAIHDGSIQGLLLATKLVLWWVKDRINVKEADSLLPVASHLRVLRGQKACDVRSTNETVTSDVQGTSIAAKDHALAKEADASAENEVVIQSRDTLAIVHGTCGDDNDQMRQETQTSRLAVEEETADEDALMARAIALSLSPEISLKDQNDEITTGERESIVRQSSDTHAEELIKPMERPDSFSAEEILALHPFEVFNDAKYVDGLTVAVTMLAKIHKSCSEYLESAASGILSSDNFVQPHPMLFMLVNSILTDIHSLDMVDGSQDFSRSKLGLFKPCALLILLRILECNFFHVDFAAISPASVGLGHGKCSTRRDESDCTSSNPVIDSLRHHVTKLLDGKLSEDVVSDAIRPIIFVNNETYTLEDVARAAQSYYCRVREQAFATWARGCLFFYGSHVELRRAVMNALTYCNDVHKRSLLDKANLWRFHQLDLMCARLCLPDVAVTFVPHCLDVTETDSIGRLPEEDDISRPDDAAVLNILSRQDEHQTLLWNTEMIKECLETGDLSPHYLNELISKFSSAEDFEADLDCAMGNDMQNIDSLCAAYDQLRKHYQQKEAEACESIKVLPKLMDLLMASISSKSWPSFSFKDDYKLKHAPLVPMLDNCKKENMFSINARVLLLRSLQDFIVERLSGFKGENTCPLEFDSSRCAETMTLSQNNRTAKQYTAKQWGMVMAITGCAPNTGVHEWAVRLDRCEKGHIFLGVCTRDASVATYVGGDRQGWGLIGTRALWHNRCKVRGDYGDGFSTGSVVRVRLNTDSGALSFGIDDNDWGIAFDGLTQHGTLYPAIGLYQRDDQITILPVQSIAQKPDIPYSALANKNMVEYPAVLQSFLFHTASLMERSCTFLSNVDLNSSKLDNQLFKITNCPFFKPLLIPLVASLSSLKDLHGMSTLLAMHMIPWAICCIKQLQKTIKAARGSDFITGSPELLLDVDGEWELKSLAAGSIPAQQYHVEMSQSDGNISGRSRGSFATVTLHGAVRGTKICFIEAWRQGGTCFVEGRLRADGLVFDGSYEDGKGQACGSIVGSKIVQNSESQVCTHKAQVNQLVLWEMYLSNLFGRLNHELMHLNVSADVLVCATASSIQPEKEHVVMQSITSSDTDIDDALPRSDIATCDYDEWVNSSLLSGGLPLSRIRRHLQNVLQLSNRLTCVPALQCDTPILDSIRDKWLRTIMPHITAQDEIKEGSYGSSDEFLMNFMQAKGNAVLIDRWVSRHVGESTLLRVGGEPFKLARRSICAAMIWHCGFLQNTKKLAQCAGSGTPENVSRPHEIVMHIWRAAQRVAEWGIRAKNSMGSTYAIVAALIIRKAQFLLDVEPSLRALAAASTASLPRDTGNTLPTATYESAERTCTDVLMQVSRFLESPLHIPHLQQTMLIKATQAHFRIIAIESIRFYLGDHKTITRSDFTETFVSTASQSCALRWLTSRFQTNGGSYHAIENSAKSMSDTAATTYSTGGQIQDVGALHHLHDLGGAGRYLEKITQTSFESLYSLLCAGLSRATWSKDIDLQLAILQTWGLVIKPDDHAFLSRVGIFRVLQTVLDEARAHNDSDLSQGKEDKFDEMSLVLEAKKKVVQAALKVVHLLAAQVAQASDCSSILTQSDAKVSDEASFGTIPLARKPSGPETLGKSVFNMLYTELRNVIRGFMHDKKHFSFHRNEAIVTPVSSENRGIDSPTAGESFDYCYQICSLLYSVSGSPVCRAHISAPHWIRLLLSLVEMRSPHVQRRILKLLRRLLPSIDPSTISFRSCAMGTKDDMLDLDSDEDLDSATEGAKQPEVLVTYFVNIICSFVPPSLATEMLQQQHGLELDYASSAETHDVLATEVILLLRSLYTSACWAPYLNRTIMIALQDVGKLLRDRNCISNNLQKNDTRQVDSDVEMEDAAVRHSPSLAEWEKFDATYRKALSVLCLLEGYIVPMRVGATVSIIPRANSPFHELAVRGVKGTIVEYDTERSTAEIVIRPLRATGTPETSRSSGFSLRPVRIPIDDLVTIPEVDLDLSKLSKMLMQEVLVKKYVFYADEIKKSLAEFKQTDFNRSYTVSHDDEDDISNEGSATPSAIDSEMTSVGVADDGDSDVEYDASSSPSKVQGLPVERSKRASNLPTISDSDIEAEIAQEIRLYRMLICQHGIRGIGNFLRDKTCADIFINGIGPEGLGKLFHIASFETPTGGLADLVTLEESWLYLWTRWVKVRSAKSSRADARIAETVYNTTKPDSSAPTHLVQQMMEMGFPREWCEIALAKCANNVEAAINFCFEHSSDMEGLLAQYKAGKDVHRDGTIARRKEDADMLQLLEQLSEMGFPAHWCKKALAANRNNVDAALTWILSNGENLEAEDRREEVPTDACNDEDKKQEVGGGETPTNPLRLVSGQASIGESNMMVEGLVGGGFASVGAPDCLVFTGRWYYEAVLHTNGCIQIGWADTAFCGAADRGDGVGDGAHSWAYDGWRQQKWHGLSSPWGMKWNQGDVVGCAVDADSGTIIFTLNGKMGSANMGIAFRAIKFAGGLYPCASFNRRERLQFNLGSRPFRYAPPPGFRPIIDVLMDHIKETSIQIEKTVGFGAIGMREDALEECLGDETYYTEARFFSRDAHVPSMLRGSLSHVRSGAMSSIKFDVLSEFQSITDDRIYMELLLISRSLAILHARRAVVTLLTSWPSESVGQFSLSALADSVDVGKSERGDKCSEATQLLEFIKLVAGSTGQTSLGINSQASFVKDDIGSLSSCGTASGRTLLRMMTPAMQSALRCSLKQNVGSSSELDEQLISVILESVKSEVCRVSERLYARVPWDSSDNAISTCMLQISSEGGAPWSDKEILNHPNIFFAEWLSELLMEQIAGCNDALADLQSAMIRKRLVLAWATCLKSPSICVKQRGTVVIAGILQDMLISVEHGGDARCLAEVLTVLPVKRLLLLAQERLQKEYPNLPVCSKYLQNLTELVLASCLSAQKLGLPPPIDHTTDEASILRSCKALQRDFHFLNAAEYESYIDAKAKKEDCQEIEANNNIRTGSENNSEPSNETEVGECSGSTSMEIDSSDTQVPNVTLSAIADMVAEDNDVVATVAGLATDRHVSANQIIGYKFIYPEPECPVDTDMLNDSEKSCIEAARYGLVGTDLSEWPYGVDLGVLSDGCAELWSGSIRQFRLDLHEENTSMQPEVGSKVIRGPDWKWRDQDGGEGSIGVVEGISQWSGNEREGMSVRWPNNAVYTYRWGSDGHYDLTQVEVDEEGTIIKKYPVSKPLFDTENCFGSEWQCGLVLHLCVSTEKNNDGTEKLCGVLEWPDQNASSHVVGWRSEEGTVCIQELQLLRGSADMGWSLRFGTERWQPGTKYVLNPVISDEQSRYTGKDMAGTFLSVGFMHDQILQLHGEVLLSTRHLFTMDPYNHFSTLSISDDGISVTCTSGDTRNLALGTVGFSAGIYYWEVHIEQAEFGGVFLGVCEKSGPPGSQSALASRLNRWNGWGFVNFRASYHNSTERIYGDHFNAGDTIGVRLDMEQGKLAFFMDGIKYGEHIVTDLGVAFDNIKGERNSRTLYPCIGMRKGGDRVSLNGKWVALPAVSPKHIIADAISVSTQLDTWFESLQNKSRRGYVALSETTLRESWEVWKRWRQQRWERYPVRPRGVFVDLDTLPASCIQVSQNASLHAPLLAGDRVRICSKGGRELDQPEEAVILGVYRGHLWYRTETQGNEGAEEGRSWAWYFSQSELMELILIKRDGKDMTDGLDSVSMVESKPCILPDVEAESDAVSSFSVFVRLATEKHTTSSDMQLVERLNEYCASTGVDADNLAYTTVFTPAERSESGQRAHNQSFLPDDYYSSLELMALSGSELRARCAVLRVLNRKILRILPLICIQSTDGGSPNIQVVDASSSAANGHRASGTSNWQYMSTSYKLRSLRRIIFTSTKRVFWDALLRATTTSTPLPSDEYEDPREIRVIRINRIQAQPSKLSVLAQTDDRLRRSVFGQLYREMRTWSDSAFRRAYCGKGHGGQRRAFKVKFLGEGVNDYGGPYRAVFEQVVDELQTDNVELSKGEQGLLPLLIPCPNRQTGTGSNQDKFLLSPSCGISLQSNTPMALDLYRFLGKLIGTAVRHGLQMGLNLPSLVWRPLAGLEVGRPHLESVDVIATNNLLFLETCSKEDAVDYLEHLTFSSPLSDGTELPLCPDGDKSPVTYENRLRYTRLVEKLRLTESSQQLAALRSGLASVLPMEVAPLFTARELEAFICGRREVDIELLRQCTEYDTGVDESMPHIQYFWEVLKEMTNEDRTSFLRFVWARSRMPNSAKDFPMNFKIQAAHGQGSQDDRDKYLPHAQTCFFSLSLPAYTSKEILRAKLLYAIQNSPNMDADVRLHNAEGWADA